MNDKKLTNEAVNVKPHRLSKQEIEDNFTDLHPPPVSYTHLTLPTKA